MILLFNARLNVIGPFLLIGIKMLKINRATFKKFYSLRTPIWLNEGRNRTLGLLAFIPFKDLANRSGFQMTEAKCLYELGFTFSDILFSREERILKKKIVTT